MAERLRRLTRNQLGSPRAGSSPAVCESPIFLHLHRFFKTEVTRNYLLPHHKIGSKFDKLEMETRCKRGRVVKAIDLKSIGVSPRRFKSCRLRKINGNMGQNKYVQAATLGFCISDFTERRLQLITGYKFILAKKSKIN